MLAIDLLFLTYLRIDSRPPSSLASITLPSLIPSPSTSPHPFSPPCHAPPSSFSLNTASSSCASTVLHSFVHGGVVVAASSLVLVTSWWRGEWCCGASGAKVWVCVRLSDPGFSNDWVCGEDGSVRSRTECEVVRGY